MENAKERIQWLDVLKCLTMLLVVIGHAVPKDTADTLGYYLYSFHMPLFFMISGMTFYLQMQKRAFTFPQLVQNKAKGLLIPYFALNFLSIPIWILNYRILSYKNESIAELIGAIFYGNAHFKSAPSNALWFCLNLFVTLLAFWLAYKWACGDEKNLTLLVLVIGSFGYAMSLREGDFNEPWRLETVPVSLMCLLAGWLFICHLDFCTKLLGNWKRQLLLVLLLFPAAFCCARYNVKISMASNSYGSFLFFAGSVLGFGLICIILARKLPPLRIFRFMGRNTIVILAFHAPVFRFLENYSEQSAAFFETYPVVTACFVFVGMIPVCYVFERFFPFLLGRSRRKASRLSDSL